MVLTQTNCMMLTAIVVIVGGDTTHLYDKTMRQKGLHKGAETLGFAGNSKMQMEKNLSLMVVGDSW